MKKYQVWAYTGFAWLNNLGVFDSYDEAQDALQAEYDRQADSPTPEDGHYFDEVFWFDSRIEEIG